MNTFKTLKGILIRPIGRVTYLLLTALTVALLCCAFALLNVSGFTGWQGVEQGAWLPFSNLFTGSSITKAAIIAAVLIQSWFTALRLKHAGFPFWIALGLFVPKINLFIILWSLVMPKVGTSKTELEGTLQSIAKNKAKLWPYIAVGIGITVGGAGAWISISYYDDYGELLFFFMPFLVGLVSTFLYTIVDHKTLGQCLTMSMLTALFGLGLLLFGGIEGVICIAMALPIIAVPILAGAWLGYAIQQHKEIQDHHMPALSSVLALLPLLFIIEGNKEPAELPLVPVMTYVDIDAPRETVWKNVIAFAELEEPTELIFLAGVAYPIKAVIEGSGVGAVRHCVFSTGAFVEPITIWDEPSLLAFKVIESPPTMDELSPYDIHPQHLDGYFRSERGQFDLIDLGNGRTRLKGTTWYRQDLAPNAYWHLWTDHMIHTVHKRVLAHIKERAEDG